MKFYSKLIKVIYSVLSKSTILTIKVPEILYANTLAYSDFPSALVV